MPTPARAGILKPKHDAIKGTRNARRNTHHTHTHNPQVLEGQAAEAARGAATYGRGAQLLGESNQLLAEAVQGLQQTQVGTGAQLMAGSWAVYTCDGGLLPCAAVRRLSWMASTLGLKRRLPCLLPCLQMMTMVGCWREAARLAAWFGSHG